MTIVLKAYVVRAVAAHIALLAGAALAAGPTNDPAPATPSQAAVEPKACDGMANEGIRRKELTREMGAYIGEALPEELVARVNRHVAKVAELKAECERLRSGNAAASR